MDFCLADDTPNEGYTIDDYSPDSDAIVSRLDAIETEICSGARANHPSPRPLAGFLPRPRPENTAVSGVVGRRSPDGGAHVAADGVAEADGVAQAHGRAGVGAAHRVAAAHHAGAHAGAHAVAEADRAAQAHGVPHHGAPEPGPHAGAGVHAVRPAGGL